MKTIDSMKMISKSNNTMIEALNDVIEHADGVYDEDGCPRFHVDNCFWVDDFGDKHFVDEQSGWMVHAYRDGIPVCGGMFFVHDEKATSLEKLAELIIQKCMELTDTVKS